MNFRSIYRFIVAIPYIYDFHTILSKSQTLDLQVKSLFYALCDLIPRMI